MASPDITADAKLDRARRMLEPLQRIAKEAADVGEREAAQARVDELLAQYPELSIPVPVPEPEPYLNARASSWRQEEVWSTHTYSSARSTWRDPSPIPTMHESTIPPAPGGGGRPGLQDDGAFGSSRQWHARRPRGAGGGF